MSESQLTSRAGDSTFSIPEDWVDAASLFADLRQRVPLSDETWQAVFDWLGSTEFNDRNYLAGEVAAGLIRDMAPALVKSKFEIDEMPDKWRRGFLTIIHGTSVVATEK